MKLKPIRSLFKARQKLLLENLALRQQLAVVNRLTKRPQLIPSDRMFWVVLLRIWRHLSVTLPIVRPKTVVRWDRQGFRQTVLGPEKPTETRTSSHRYSLSNGSSPASSVTISWVW